MSSFRNYKYIWSEKRSLINVEAHIRQYIEQRDILGSTHNYSFLYGKNGIAEELHRDIDNQRWIKIGKKFLQKNFVSSLLTKGKELREEFNSFLSTISTSRLLALSDQKMSGLFMKSCHFHSRLRGYFKTSRPEFLTFAEVKLKKLLARKLSDDRLIQQAFETLTTPSQMEEVNNELLDWAELVLKGATEQQIIRHIYKYPWLIAHTFDKDQIKADIKKRYSNDRKHLVAIRENLKSLKKYKQKLKNDQQEWLKYLNHPQINYLSWLFQELSLERMRLKGGWAGSDFLYFDLYKEISRRTKTSLKDLYLVYRIKEVLTAIKQHKPILKRSEIKARKIAYVFWLRNKKLSFYRGRKALSIITKKLRSLIKTATLRGQIASAGHAIGKARIIIPGDILMLNKAGRLFKQGEILVTAMTQPNMVPIMRKSVAIVTDEGGLTSHAAIIAREFRIPCVVGTQVATKILKDGDLVEVDAIKGVVKKI